MEKEKLITMLKALSTPELEKLKAKIDNLLEKTNDKEERSE